MLLVLCLRWSESALFVTGKATLQNVCRASGKPELYKVDDTGKINRRRMRMGATMVPE